MIARRLAAIALAIVLIVGAWIVRERVIDDGGRGTADPVNAGVLVCPVELVDLCRQVASGELDIVGQPAGETLDFLASESGQPALWLTFDGFPQMLNVARDSASLEQFSYSAAEVASSPIAVVVRNERAAELVQSCGDPVDFGCVGAQTQLAPALSPIDSGIGLLSVAAAVSARSDEANALDDVALLSWARAFQRAAAKWDLSGGTAVQTMQTRTSIAAAFGAEAELVPAQRANFTVLYADPMVRARVVLWKPTGFDVPPNLASDLGDALRAAGWAGPVATEPGALPPAATMLGIREFWKGLS